MFSEERIYSADAGITDSAESEITGSSADSGAPSASGGGAAGDGQQPRRRNNNRRGRGRRRGRGGKPRIDDSLVPDDGDETEIAVNAAAAKPQQAPQPASPPSRGRPDNRDAQPSRGRPDNRNTQPARRQNTAAQSNQVPDYLPGNFTGSTPGNFTDSIPGSMSGTMPGSMSGYQPSQYGIITPRNDDAILDAMPPDPTLDAVFADTPVKEAEPDEGTEIVGIRFGQGSKVYYFAPAGIAFHYGDHAVVETSRGMEFGDVALPNRRVPDSEIVQPLREVLRRATPGDIAHNEENHRREDDAFRICIGKIEAHRLEMKLVGAQYTFDGTKLIFYFTSSGRVDFRELVKDLASVFRTRIELRQIGIRDEAKMIGGWGVCGRKLCCANFLPNFAQVSIRMAKEQGLSLNSSKISGTCGRLMCCLRFEQESYEREIAAMPPADSVVQTADGRGIVLEIHPIAGTLKVKLDDKPDQPAKNYRLVDVRVISRATSRRGQEGEQERLTSASDDD